MLLAVLVAALLLVPASATSGPVWRTAVVGGDYEAEIATFAADGPYLVVWIAPGYGLRDEHLAFAGGLAAAGMEVWMTDLVDAYFLTRDRNAQLRIDPGAVADLVESAHRRTGKSVVLMGTGSAAIPVLRGARAWQARADPQPYLIGAVLLSPSLYRGVPELGKEPEFLPIVGATSIPVALLQAARRSGGQRLPALTAALSSGGSRVYAQLMPQVGTLFAKEALSAKARSTLEALPARIGALLPLLEGTDYAADPAPLAQAPVTERPSLDASLKPFAGHPPAPAIELKDTDGKAWRVDDYRGRVTLINFWAGWCPPCVKEIPSLSRLQGAMAQTPFKLISVDFGESPEVVRAFLDRVEVDFPVLLDADGAVSKAWKVIGLPSTFVVAPDGRIRYGANGAIHWDSPEVVEALKALGRDPSRAARTAAD